MTNRKPRPSGTLAVLLLAGAAAAAEPRPLSPDRPDATESPYTVEPRRAQIETEVAAYLRDRAQEDPPRLRREGWALAVTNVKLGLTERLDVQLVLEPYLREETVDAATGARAVAEGLGDLTLRAKLNLWGNDGGATACAVMPFVTFPTASEGLGAEGVEGGVILPLAVDVPHGFGLGVQLQLDAVRAGGSYDIDVSHTVSLSRDLVGDLSGFVELFSLFPDAGDAAWVGTLNAGLVYAVHEDLQLDAGVRVGLSRAADDLVLFVGLTRRF